MLGFNFDSISGNIVNEIPLKILFMTFLSSFFIRFVGPIMKDMKVRCCSCSLGSYEAVSSYEAELSEQLELSYRACIG